MSKKCCLCENLAETTIKDATLYPKIYNGKPICKPCNQQRKDLKADSPD